MFPIEEVQSAISGKEPDAVGGSGLLYRTLLRGQPVAIKVVTLAGLVDSSRALLAREVELLASMARHPNIVQLRGCVGRSVQLKTYACRCAICLEFANVVNRRHDVKELDFSKS